VYDKFVGRLGHVALEARRAESELE